jgi:hypothetical protein
MYEAGLQALQDCKALAGIPAASTKLNKKASFSWLFYLI